MADEQAEAYNAQQAELQAEIDRLKEEAEAQPDADYREDEPEIELPLDYPEDEENEEAIRKAYQTSDGYDG